MFSLELSCFFDYPTDVGHLISGSSAFYKSSLNIWKFRVHILLKPGLETFEHYFASMWVQLAVVWLFFGIAFLWDWNKNWPFPVLWPLLSFPNLLAYWIQSRKEASKERKSKDTLILDLQPPNLWGNKCLLLKSPSSWYFVSKLI